MRRCACERQAKETSLDTTEAARHEQQNQQDKAPARSPLSLAHANPTDTVSPSSHASELSRAQMGGGQQAQQALLKLQRRHGNRYVQRVVEVARKGQGEADVNSEVEQAIETKRGGGQELDRGVRSQMEPALGADFSRVRVHADGEADTLNRALSARAFATGRDIFFRHGEYRPGASAGRELLAHELTHVVQQGGGVRRKMTLGQPHDRHEQEADQAARSLMRAEQQASNTETPAKKCPQCQNAAANTTAGVSTALQQQATGEEEKEEKESIGRKPVASEGTALVRRQNEGEEEKEGIRAKAVAAQAAPGAQRQLSPEPESEEKEDTLASKPLQRKPLSSDTSGALRRQLAEGGDFESFESAAETESISAEEETAEAKMPKPGPGLRLVSPGARRAPTVPAGEAGEPAEAPPTTPAAREQAYRQAEETSRETAASSEPEHQRSVGVNTADEAVGGRVEGEVELPVDVGAPAADPAAGEAAAASLAQKGEQAAAEEGAEAEGEVAEEGGEGGAAPQAAGGEEGGGGGAGAIEAGAEALSTLAGPMADASRLRASHVAFAPRRQTEAANPREMQRRTASEAVASGFLARAGRYVEDIVAQGAEAVPRIGDKTEQAKADIDAAVAQDSEAVKTHIAEARQQAKAQATQTKGYLASQRAGVVAAAKRDAGAARKRAKKAYTDAKKELETQTTDQLKGVNKLYKTWKPKYRSAGTVAGGEATALADEYYDGWEKQIDPRTCTLLSGCYHDNKLKARMDVATKVGRAYRKEFKKVANEQAAKITKSKPGIVKEIKKVAKQAREGLQKQFKATEKAINGAEKQAKSLARKTARQMQAAVDSALGKTLASLDQQETVQVSRFGQYGEAQKQALDGVAAQAIASIADGVTQATGALNQSMGQFMDSAAAMEAPDQGALTPVLGDVEAQTEATANTMQQQLGEGTQSSEAGVAAGGKEAVQALGKLTGNAKEQASFGIEAFGKSLATLKQQAVEGFAKLKAGNTKTADGIAKNAEKGFKDAETQIKTSFKKLGKAVEDNFAKGKDELQKSLWPGKDNKTKDKYKKAIEDNADKAAAKVKPRWKKILKWVVTIVVVIAVIVVTVLSAGALGPVGIVLLGATLGALAGAATQIGHNLIDGEKWNKGVVKAMIVGGIGGAFGGLGGVIFKGVGTVALKIGLEAGLDVIGGIVGEVAGSLAVGESLNWTGIIVGSLIGAGVGAGLGIGAALKGKFKPKVDIGGPTPSVKPTADVGAPATPSKGVRGFLERTKILAPKGPKPRPGAGVPEMPKGRPTAEVPSGKPTAPEVPTTKPTAPEAPGGRPVAEGPTPTGRKSHADAPEIEDGVVAKQSTPDGHEVKVLKDGRVVRCTTCEDLRLKYGSDDYVKGRLDNIEATPDPATKATKTKELLEELGEANPNSPGAKAAKTADYGEPPPGHHWGMRGDSPVLVKNPKYKGPKKYHDPETNTFVDKPTAAGELGFGTTTDKMRKAVAGEKYRDPTDNTLKDLPFGETMAPDHIFPVSKIKELDGFNDLTLAQKKAIIYDMDNIQPLPSKLNSSKGGRTAAEWKTTKALGKPLDDGYVDWLAVKQAKQKKRLQKKIYNLLGLP